MSKKWNVTYYIEADGTKPVEEYIRKLSLNERAKTLAFVDHLEEKNRIYTDRMLIFWKMEFMNYGSN